MGWSGGTDLFESIIKAAKKFIPIEYERKAFYKTILPAFQDADWDCEGECIDSDKVFEELYNELYPE